MSLRYRKRLLDHLQHRSYTPRKLEQLALDLGIDDTVEFGEAVESLAGEGVIEVSDGGLVTLPSVGEQREIEGTFKKNPRGFGFVRTDDPMHEGDLFIPPEMTGEALTGDRVRVRVRKEKRRGGSGASGPGGRSPYVGEIVEVVTRKRSQFTGELRKQGSQWLVMPDGRELREPVVVRDPQAKNAREGDKVVIELLEYPTSNAYGGTVLGEGVIVRVLGKTGEPDVETQAVIAAFSLPGEFPGVAVDQARGLAGEFDDEVRSLREASRDSEGHRVLEGSDFPRLDLTDEFILTIDPPDAKDYDDAISIRRSDKGWELGVHIADVAHFVKPGTPLDEEARERGNSVYLPRLVIPMLPEVLSNGICSLQEGVPRFTKSAFMRYDLDGNISAEGVASTLIKSAKRLTYLEAQALIDGNVEEAKRHAKTEPNYTPPLLAALREMDTLAKRIQERRRKQGMISLELPEVVLIYDDEGRVIDAEREDDAFTHKLIEMFMVEANEVLARLFEKMNVPLLRRVHPEPTPGDVDELRRTAKVAGFNIPSNPTREQLQALLDATRGTPAARAVHMAVLRTLTKAEYSPALIGHFALASEAYAHFTSPIRRYADLTVHTALGEYLRATDNAKRRPKTDEERTKLGRKLREKLPDEATLVQVGRHITTTEENAEDAERQLRQFLVLQLLEKHIGESFRGVVTGVSARGVFVQLDKFLVDGIIKITDLPGDPTRGGGTPLYKIDQRSGALVDQKSGRSFNMGDTVVARIANVDLARRQLDLVLEDAASRAAGKAKKPVPEKVAGGMAHSNFKPLRFDGMTGEQRRSRKSKSRDKGKKQHRREKGR
ncbi:MAG: VacB/RNase II family 3'-5' exoribonuclease [Phycisphaerales bacterium]